MKVNFNFQTRQGMTVANAIAEEVLNGTRPVLLSIQGMTFRFERGLAVKPDLVELSQFQESWRTPKTEEWVVTHATIRFYELDESFSRVSDKKKEEIWDHTKLLALKNARWWHHPHVRDIISIKGRVCVFWDNASQSGHIEANPEYNQDGYYILVDEVFYQVLKPGDMEKAKKEANKILDSYYEEVE